MDSHIRELERRIETGEDEARRDAVARSVLDDPDGESEPLVTLAPEWQVREQLWGRRSTRGSVAAVKEVGQRILADLLPAGS